jgi:hypothetical protein
MKKKLIAIISGFLVAGCGATMAGNTDTKTKYADSAAVMLTAVVSIPGTGVDTPTDEANDKVAKIGSASVTVSDAAGKTIDTIKLKKIETSIKGEILKFNSGYIGVPNGSVKFKFDFNDSANKSLFSTEEKADLKAKTVFNINGNLEQVAKSKDPAAPETLKVEVSEVSDKSYTSGEFIASLKNEIKEEELKSMLVAKGIKVSALKKSILKAYTVQFTFPSVAEALILADQTEKFEYVEPNGYVSIQ